MIILAVFNCSNRSFVLLFQTPNSYFIYTVTDPTGLFSIDRHSGVLSLASSLDREKVKSTTLKITTVELEPSVVKEKPPRATVTVNVAVADVNDNGPVFVPGEPGPPACQDLVQLIGPAPHPSLGRMNMQ